MQVEMIQQIGPSLQGYLQATYLEILNVLGEPNATGLDDPDKVKASWGFRDPISGMTGFIWCYKEPNPETCTQWSVAGNPELFDELFDVRAIRWL